MIQSKVFKLKKDVEVGKDMPLKMGQEIEVVLDVIYINGYPLPPELQDLFYNFVMDNPLLFDDATKNW